MDGGASCTQLPTAEEARSLVVSHRPGRPDPVGLRTAPMAESRVAREPDSGVKLEPDMRMVKQRWPVGEQYFSLHTAASILCRSGLSGPVMVTISAADWLNIGLDQGCDRARARARTEFIIKFRARNSGSGTSLHCT